MAQNTQFENSDKPHLGGNKEFADKLRGIATDRTAGAGPMGLPGKGVGKWPKHKGAEQAVNGDGGANLGGYFD